MVPSRCVPRDPSRRVLRYTLSGLGFVFNAREEGWSCFFFFCAYIASVLSARRARSTGLLGSWTRESAFGLFARAVRIQAGVVNFEDIELRLA